MGLSLSIGCLTWKGESWQHHGSESYFVIGEGLLGEAGGGRERTLAAALEAETPPFRFYAHGPERRCSKQLGDPIRKKIAQAMVAATRSASRSRQGSRTSGSSSTTI